MEKNELRIEHLCKKYQKTEMALNDFSYTFTDGIYGLLGPNGAGKSTLMNIITSNIRETSGKILYNGRELSKWGREYKKKIGYMPQNQNVYPEFTLERFLYYMSALKGVDRKQECQQIMEIAGQVNLLQSLHKQLGCFSGGMKQRAMLAQALQGDPQIVILDEPTAGLDPKERIHIRNIISEIALKKIVIVATHVVQDVEVISKKILLMQKGSLMLADHTDALCEKLQGKVWKIHCGENELREIEHNYLVENISKSKGKLRVRIVTEKLPEKYISVKAEPSLEDVYLYYFQDR